MLPIKRLPSALQDLSDGLPAKVSFVSSKEGGYWVKSQDLPGCYAQGDTLHEASKNFKLALFDYFDVPKKYHDEKLLFYVTSNLFEDSEVKSLKESVSIITREAVPA